MKFEYHNKTNSSFFGLTDDLQKDADHFSERHALVKFIWNRNRKPVRLHIDDRSIILRPKQILTTTFFHHAILEAAAPPLTSLLFNREFYCLNDHDNEVSCNGILFYGTQEIPVITIPEDQYQKFRMLLNVLADEFQTHDKIQGDMLQMLLKRFIIICTRLAKEQLAPKKLEHKQIDIIRRFNFLVDVHFKDKKQVKDYAALLNKSPKTLSNLFLLYNQKTPHQIIHERVALEAKRLLQFSEMNTKEIAFELGFDEPANFSNFFKNVVGTSPSDYRASRKS